MLLSSLIEKVSRIDGAKSVIRLVLAALLVMLPEATAVAQTADPPPPAVTTCSGGMAGTYPCSNIDLMSFLALDDIGGGSGNDIWGWTDSSTGEEYAIMGRTNGTSFVDISDPVNPIYLGNLPPHSANSTWRDIKVYADHAFIVTEADNSGMQVFDLTQLREVASPPATFSETAHYSGFGDAHNLAINEDSGFAYAVGTNNCGGGLHMINIQTPTNPTSAGCFSADGFTHDAQCVNYDGPDLDHQGKEICFNSNGDTLTIVDVTNKAVPVMLSRTGYSGSGYTHQGWLTEDQVYFLLGDELDERDATNTRTYMWDVSDLDDPALIGFHESTTTATDHNQYVKGSYTYQSNYRAGLRILDITDIANGNLSEEAFFDIYPDDDSPDFNGAWSNYPFFNSGIVIVSGEEQGLFVLRPNLVTASVSGVRVTNITQTGATVTVTIANPGSSQKTVYLRYRTTPNGAWSATQEHRGSAASRTFALSKLAAETEYEVEASRDSRFPADSRVSVTFTTLVDTRAPTVSSITSDATHPTKDPFTVTIIFSEAVTGLTANEIAVTNGTGSNFAGTGASYTLDIEPNANLEGDVTVRVPANAALDAANLGNIEGSETFAVDTRAPTVSSITSDATHPTKDAFTVTIIFSEAVTGLTANEIAVTNGTGSNLAGTGASYTLDIEPNANLEGDVTVRVPANAALDAADNGNVQGSETFAVDTRAPTVVSIASGATHPTKDAFTVTITFSEEVTGLTSGEIAVTNGTGSNFAGTGASYTLDIEPNANLEGEVTVRVPANAALDGADNGNVQGSETFAVDTRAPVFQSAAVDGATLTLSYGEALDGNSTLGVGDFTAAGGDSARTVSNVAVSGTAVTLTLDPAVEHGESGITVSYRVPGTNPIRDAVGNDADGLSEAPVTNTTGAPNTAPEIITSQGLLDVRENQARVTRLTATDADPGDEVTGWAIVSGADRGRFTVASDTGELGFRAAPNFEAPSDVLSSSPPSGAGDNEYIVVARVSSGAGARELTTDYAIRVRVTDVDEPPSQPTAPTITGETADGLTVEWTEPDNTGPPITGYDVQYREGGSGGFTDARHEGTGRTATLTGLSEATAYQVSVRARNEERTGPWSEPGEGRTIDPLTVRMTTGLAPPVEGPFTLRFRFSEAVTGFTRGDIATQQQPPCTDTGNLPVPCTPSLAAFQTTDNQVFTTTVTPLTAGVAHNYTLTISVRANTVTSSLDNKPNEAATLAIRVAPPGVTVPISSLGMTASPGNGQVTLRWNAPENTGGAPIVRYEYRVAESGGEFSAWMRVDAAETSATAPDLTNGREYVFELRGVNALGYGGVKTVRATPATGGGGGGGGFGGGGGGPRTSAPGVPGNLTAVGGDGQVVLTWEAPASDGGAAITDYEYRINGRNPWISIGSTDTTHTVTGLDNGTAYTFEVRAVNRVGKGRVPNQAEATPEAPEVFTLDFAHFANGDGTTSDLVFVNAGSVPVLPALYFYGTEGALVSAESVVDVTGNLAVTEDGALTVLTAMEPLGELTISTHGRGDVVSGSVTVVSDAPVGAMLRFALPGIGETVMGASPPISDTLFPVRRQEGGITTGVAVHNRGAEAMEVMCELMQEGVLRDAVSLPLEANGQTSWLIDQAFPAADTSDFVGSVRCDADGEGLFSAVALEMDPGTRTFITLPLFPVNRLAGGRAAVLDFAHFANGDGTTSDLVFLNLSTERSRPAPTPFHVAIPPIRPAIYFYDTEGALVSAESLVDLTGDLASQEDGGLTVLTDMEPLGVLTVSTHGRGALVSGSVKVVSDGPIGGMLRYDLPHIGVAVVGASPPLGDAIFPVRRREEGGTTGVALHNLESSPGLVHCDLMREGVLRDAASFPLEANGQTSWLIGQAFPAADTSDFTGSVRCDAVGEGLFSAVALEMDPGTRVFTALPVFPVEESMSQE